MFRVFVLGLAITADLMAFAQQVPRVTEIRATQDSVGSVSLNFVLEDGHFPLRWKKGELVSGILVMQVLAVNGPQVRVLRVETLAAQREPKRSGEQPRRHFLSGGSVTTLRGGEEFALRLVLVSEDAAGAELTLEGPVQTVQLLAPTR